MLPRRSHVCVDQADRGNPEERVIDCQRNRWEEPHVWTPREIQHVTEVVKGSTLLAVCQTSKEVRQKFCCEVLWRTHAGKPRGRGCDYCVDFGALRNQELDPSCEERPSTFARPDIYLLHNFQVGTELHARDGRSDCV